MALVGSRARSSILPRCVFGDGCLLKLTDDVHNQHYVHDKSILQLCPDIGIVSGVGTCAMYKIARDYVINGGEKTKEISVARDHCNRFYHPPIYSTPVRDESKPRYPNVN